MYGPDDNSGLTFVLLFFGIIVVLALCRWALA